MVYTNACVTVSIKIKLVEKKIISQASLQQMTTWIKGPQAAEPEYGLGLEYFQYAPGTTPQFGYEGDGIGCSTMMLYVPDTNTYLYMSCNVGRVLGGPFLYKIIGLKTELCTKVATWK